MAGCTAPHVIGPGRSSCTSTSTRRRMRRRRLRVHFPTASARDHGSADRRSERTCHRPISTGERNIAIPAIHPTSSTVDRRSGADGGVTGGTAAVGGRDAAGGIVLAPSATAGVLFCAVTGNTMRTGGATIDTRGNTRSTPNAAASHAWRTAARQLRATDAPISPRSEEDRGFHHNRRGERTAYREQDLRNGGHHDCFFLSSRTRSISALSASSSSSDHGASATRAVIICLSEPPKKVCRYCCKAVRLATAERWWPNRCSGDLPAGA